MAETQNYELNELEWWSKWVDETVWLSKNAFAVFSKEFADEYFFNRGGFVGAERVHKDAVEAIEKEFAKRKLSPPCILVEHGPVWDQMRAMLASRGYAAAEKMLVMVARKSPKNESSQVEVSALSAKAGKEIQVWTKTYLAAFYGDQKHAKKVSAIMAKVVKDKKSTVVLARIGGEVAGCAVLHRSAGGVAGAYCIGTVPEHRKKGVAAAMVGFMGGLAAKEKRELFLQTLASDSLEGFYEKLGFESEYTKTYFERRRKAKAQNAIPSGEDFGVVINRDAVAGAVKPFLEVFKGFESVGAVKELFGPETEKVLAKLRIHMTSTRGYLRVDGETGDVIINPEYLKNGPERYLYLDVIHELTHVRQFGEGKELYDRNYPYLERPTEVEAYSNAVQEARRIEMEIEEIIEYLKVEWVTEEEFERFLARMRLKP